jgi:hypothetical protein
LTLYTYLRIFKANIHYLWSMLAGVSWRIVDVSVLNSFPLRIFSAGAPFSSPLLSTERATLSAIISSLAKYKSFLSSSNAYQNCLINLALCSSFLICRYIALSSSLSISFLFALMRRFEVSRVFSTI